MLQSRNDRSIYASLTGLILLLAVPVIHADDDDDGRATVRNVTVDCARKSINAVLAKRRSARLVITVKGTCNEDVLIDRDHVTLVAATPRVDGIVSQAAGGAAVTVTGAQNAVIAGLRLRSAGGGTPVGVFLTDNAQATIRDALIEDNVYGIWSRGDSVLRVRSSDIRANRDYGILLSDSGHAEVRDSTVEIANSDLFNSAAIGAFRGINIRLRGSNLIINSGDDGVAGNGDDGFSLDLFHSIDFRQDGGHTRFIGPVEFGNLSHGSLRDPEIVGGIFLLGGSRVDVRRSSVAGPGEPTVHGNGDITVSSNSQLNFSRPDIIARVGSISVSEFSSFHMRDRVEVTTAPGSNLFVGQSRLTMAPGARLVIDGDVQANNNAEFNIFGEGSAIDVSGNMFGVLYFNMFMAPNVNLKVDGFIFLNDFSVASFADNVTIEGNLSVFGTGRARLFGNGVSYVGDISFAPGNEVTFGPNARVTGTIFCNGASVFFPSGVPSTAMLDGCI